MVTERRKMAETFVKYDDGSGYYAKNGFPPRKKFASKSKDTGLCDTLLVLPKHLSHFS